MNSICIENAESLFARFSDSSLPKVEWTHEAHLIVAIMHLKKYEFSEAVCLLKAGIILLNKNHGTVNNGQGGYHETLTVFWTCLIRLFIELNPEASAIEQVNLFLQSSLSKKEIPFIFYDREKLLSTEYRAVFVESSLALSAHTISIVNRIGR